MTRQTLDTRAVHSGREDLAALGLHAAPLDFSTAYPAYDTGSEAARLDAFAAGELPEGRPIYGRVGNTTVARFERAVADLEACAAAVAFGSGMAALTACLLASVAQGRRHIVAIRPLYGTSDHLLSSGLLGTTVTWTTAEDLPNAIRPDTGLVIAETPANPTLAEHDIARLAEAAAGVPLLVDNTFATPVLQRPVEHGAAVVLHSATKFLGGHGDVMGGVVTCGEELARAIRQIRIVTGAILHPFAGYMLLRGLATLPVRVRRAAATAADLAQRLAAHPAVTQVFYPSLDPDRPSGQMESGGCLVSFEAAVDPHVVVGGAELITPAVSLGGVDTLIQHPYSLTHRIVAEDDRRRSGISDRLLRLSVGLEDVDDLWRDLDRSLAQAYEEAHP
ncbi:PLP-dependent transferase [Nonomuraea longispora]|uniref:homocysteine desulfhydrase n=1 Tax=Nonomuraea longispora TaxID=1848320 RepID=A0A4R4NE47_9ACTN|nr:PLP-dependent transferase [Nonomuraea longispora]TDC07229.1 PLP-dependent transferase [Nonomuraea longispora]